MAPSRTPKGNKREADYSNIGVAGRKTGITLKDTGIRDQFGLEPLEGIFSSPAKQSVKRNGVNHESTIIEGEDMDIGQSTIPEPTDLLTTTRRSGKLLPLPVRTPIKKTSLGSSPRRAPMSSPRRNGTSPSVSVSHSIVSRKLDFTIPQPSTNPERSPQKTRLVVQSSLLSNKRDKPSQKPSTGKKRAFDLSMHSDDDDEDNTNQSIVVNQPVGGGQLDDGSGINGDLSQAMADDSTHELVTIAKEKTSQKRRGRPKKAEAKLASPFASSAGEKTSMDPPAAERSTQHSLQEDVFDIEVSEPASNAEINGAPPKRDGRKKGAVKIHRDNGRPGEESGPSKPAKRPKNVATEATPPMSSARKGPKPPPSERNPNARITAAKGKDNVSLYKAKENASTKGKENVPAKRKARAASVELTEPRTKPPGPKHKPRSLYVLRSETPAGEDGANVLRSGRVSVKPVAYWRGERIVYGEAKIEGKNLVLPAIKEVVRTEEVAESRPKRSSYKNRSAAVRRTRLQDVDEEDDDEDQEGWELDPGFLRAEVTKWNPDDQEDEMVAEEIALAYAPTAIQSLMREVKGAEFMFAKTVALPYFHSGIVDLPPGGIKRIKNSRNNHMVFWVFMGRVRVDVAGIQFNVGRGGMWQVPRGNFYGIANDRAKPARVLFAQGCAMTEVTQGPSQEDGAG